MQMTGLPTWAALSDGGIESLVLPADVRELLICSDHDRNGVGQAAARRAAEKWIEKGIKADIALPSLPDTDFNDLLRADVSDLPPPFIKTRRGGSAR
jgi:phage/plasmid primase-like uncharacterized protein